MGRHLISLLACVVCFANAQMVLVSSAFKNNERIPDNFCCDNVERDPFRPSIPLQWMRVPVTVQSFVLIMDEMESQKVLWAVKDIPRDIRSIESDASEVAMPAGSIELLNSFGEEYYHGPCPDGRDDQHYRFRLFAMPKAHTRITLPNDSSAVVASDYIAQVEKEALYVAVLVGNFSFVPVQLDMKYGSRQVDPNLSLPSEFPWDEQHPLPYGNANRTKSVTNTTKNDQNKNLPKSTVKLSTILVSATKNETNTSRIRPESPKPIDVVRMIKPSEAFPRSSKLPPACRNAQHDSLDECLALQTNALSNWCGSRSPTGIQFLEEDHMERCALRLRFLDLPCDHQVFARQYVCNNASSTEGSISPALQWRDAPDGTESFVITLEDASPSPKFVGSRGRLFWVVVNIPASVSEIESGASNKAMPPLSIELKNSFRFSGYTPPCPAATDDRAYLARVYAMPHRSTTLFLPSEPSSDDVQRQLKHEALCVATTQVPFSFATSLRVAERHIQPLVFRTEAGAGETPSAE